MLRCRCSAKWKDSASSLGNDELAGKLEGGELGGTLTLLHQSPNPLAGRKRDVEDLPSSEGCSHSQHVFTSNSHTGKYSVRYRGHHKREKKASQSHNTCMRRPGDVSEVIRNGAPSRTSSCVGVPDASCMPDICSQLLTDLSI